MTRLDTLFQFWLGEIKTLLLNILFIIVIIDIVEGFIKLDPIIFFLSL